MSIQAGQLAPQFHTEDAFGDPIDLATYADKFVLLAFFRNAACAICNLRVHELIKRYPAYQRAGLAIITVFESPRENIVQYVGKQDAPFPIVADPEARLYDLYGVETSEAKTVATMAMPQTQEVVREAAQAGFALTPEAGSNFHRMPAEFLIAPDQTVLLAHYANYVMDHLPFAEIEAQLGVAV